MLFRPFSQSNDDKKSDGVCFFVFFEKIRSAKYRPYLSMLFAPPPATSLLNVELVACANAAVHVSVHSA